MPMGSVPILTFFFLSLLCGRPWSHAERSLWKYQNDVAGKLLFFYFFFCRNMSAPQILENLSIDVIDHPNNITSFCIFFFSDSFFTYCIFRRVLYDGRCVQLSDRTQLRYVFVSDSHIRFYEWMTCCYFLGHNAVLDAHNF